MYTMYAKQLSDVIKRHQAVHHSYVDDTQIYIQKKAIQQLQQCIVDICSWVKTNALKLNEEKTEFIVFSRNKSPAQVVIKAGESRSMQ